MNWSELAEVSKVSDKAIKSAVSRQRRKKLAGFIFDTGAATPLCYHLIKSLGKNAHTHLYTATATGSKRAQFLIKTVQLRTRRRRSDVGIGSGSVNECDDNYFVDSVRREWEIARLIVSRCGNDVSERRTCTIVQRFYYAERKYGVMLLPFVDVADLSKHLHQRLHPVMRNFLRDVNLMFGLSGSGRLTYEELIGKLRSRSITQRMNDDLEGTLTEIVEETCHIAVQMVGLVCILHRNLIYHRNIRLDNIIIDQCGNNNLRLIDFGLAVASGSALPPVLLDPIGFCCSHKAPNNGWYADPVSHLIDIAEVTDEDKLTGVLAKFDSYACGKVVQRIFEAYTFNKHGEDVFFPVIRRTPFMPEFVFETIKTLTSENGILPDGDKSIIDYRSDKESSARAIENFHRRPSVLSVFEYFTQEYGRWTYGSSYSSSSSLSSS